MSKELKEGIQTQSYLTSRAIERSMEAQEAVKQLAVQVSAVVEQVDRFNKVVGDCEQRVDALLKLFEEYCKANQLVSESVPDALSVHLESNKVTG